MPALPCVFACEYSVRRAVQVKAVLETALTEADAPLVVADLKRDTGRPRTVGVLF